MGKLNKIDVWNFHQMKLYHEEWKFFQLTLHISDCKIKFLAIGSISRVKLIQIFPNFESCLNRTTVGKKIWQEKLICDHNSILVITFDPLPPIDSKFESGKVCMVRGLFAKAV